MTATKAFIAFAAILGAWCVWPSSKWGFEKKLPPDAADVRVWSWQDSLLPDYTYLLRARVSPVDFDRYVSELGLTPHHTERKYGQPTHWLSWSGDSRSNALWWWIPSRSLDTTFVAQEGDSWTYAKYENGYLYLKSLNH